MHSTGYSDFVKHGSNVSRETLLDSSKHSLFHCFRKYCDVRCQYTIMLKPGNILTYSVISMLHAYAGFERSAEL